MSTITPTVILTVRREAARRRAQRAVGAKHRAGSSESEDPSRPQAALVPSADGARSANRRRRLMCGQLRANT